MSTPPERHWNVASDSTHVDYFPPIPEEQTTIGVCIECGSAVFTQFKSIHVAWHERQR